MGLGAGRLPAATNMSGSSLTSILLAGGTGLVGGEVISLANEGAFDITTVGRRVTDLVDREIQWDFKADVALPTTDCAICCLGTTLRKAGSREAFRSVDYDAVLSFAKAAKRAGTDHCLVVTAAGADPNAGVFYSQVKGELERDIAAIGFERLDMLQPGLLRGRRSESRPVEALLQAAAPLLDPLMRGPWRGYRSIAAEAVARALLTLSAATTPGIYTHNNEAMIHWAHRSTNRARSA